MIGPAQKRVRNILKLADDYEVDGAIHFSTPACHQENNSLSLISAALKEKGYPVLNLPGDMTDERNYSPQRTEALLSSFFEILEQG